jgi:hypothetical protein
MIFRSGFGLKAYPSAVTEYGDQIFVRVERRIDNNLNVWHDGEDLQQLKSIEDLLCINVTGPEIRPSFRAFYDDSIPDNWPSHFLKLIERPTFIQKPLTEIWYTDISLTLMPSIMPCKSPQCILLLCCKEAGYHHAGSVQTPWYFTAGSKPI